MYLSTPSQSRPSCDSSRYPPPTLQANTVDNIFPSYLISPLSVNLRPLRLAMRFISGLHKSLPHDPHVPSFHVPLPLPFSSPTSAPPRHYAPLSTSDMNAKSRGIPAWAPPVSPESRHASPNHPKWPPWDAGALWWTERTGQDEPKDGTWA